MANIENCALEKDRQVSSMNLNDHLRVLTNQPALQSVRWSEVHCFQELQDEPQCPPTTGLLIKRHRYVLVTDRVR